jgi:ATP-dependent Lhr-like helicase
LAGEGGLVKILQQLRAAPVVGRVWERDVLPLRLAHYQPAELNALCQRGELVWAGSGGVDPRRGRVRFLFRGEGNVYLEPAPEDLSLFADKSQSIYDFLKSEGAAFFADICSALSLEAAIVETALIELVMASLVTNDSLETMRQIVHERPSQRQQQKPFSSLEQELTSRRERLGHQARHMRKPSRAKYQAAKRRVRQRLEQRADMRPPESRWIGRWTLVHRFGVLGKPMPLAERIAQQTRQLLARYGIVTRECLANEIGSWDWSLIYQQLQRLEMRGEVRRGYFVQGLSGVQFALPDVVERLRELRDSNQGQEDKPGLVVMNACDPANLYGPSRDDGPQTAQGEPLAFSRIPSTWLVQHRGWPILIAEDRGTNLTITQGVDEGLIQHALQALLKHLAHFEYRVTVKTWDGEPILKSSGQSLLEAVGFYRHYPGMVWERR